MVRSAASCVVRSALVSIAALEDLISLALSAIFLLCCSTTLAECLTAVCADLAAILLSLIAPGSRDSTHRPAIRSIGFRRRLPRVSSPKTIREGGDAEGDTAAAQIDEAGPR